MKAGAGRSGCAVMTNTTDSHVVFVYAMWVAMMAAMMLPGTAPAILRLFRASGIATGVLFTAGYLAVWAGFSLAATFAQVALDSALLLSDEMAIRSPVLAGLSVLAIGLYQFAPLKHSCLRRCAALASGARQNQSRDASAVVQGMRYGVSCLGCCWALMGLLFVVGVMNALWMVLIALWVSAEKLLPLGSHLARLAGAGLVASGGMAIAAAVL
jgi:predicted metal-binding membrane protein